MPEPTRRDFIKTLSAAGVLAAATGPRLAAEEASVNSPPTPPRPRGAKSLVGFRVAPLDTVRFGLIGVGLRGTGTLRQTLALEGCRVTALCDIYPPALERGLKLVAAAGAPTP